MQGRDVNPGPETDDEGYLVGPDDWSEDFAEMAARREGLVLGDEHWEVIGFMRRWLAEHGVAPSARDAVAFLKHKGAGRNRLFELFPYGYVGQACKIAGMKKPRAWSTG